MNARQPMRRCHVGSLPTVETNRGIALLAVLVCISVVAGLAVGMIKGAVRARTNVNLEHQARQASLLAEAGLLHAARQLASDPDYRGETWRLSDGELGCGGAAEIVLVVTTTSNEDDPRRMVATAFYPAGDPLAARRTLVASYRPESSPRPSE